ncbi:hypothetical protein ACN20G_18025 [Streptomyces sp. BI20]|uniref:hypothetical protein n=1 Tax=Streptomyces sp. BI20 TaxID=3403460 RepID=UPI003C778D78
MEVLLIILAVIALAIVALGAYATVKAVGAAKRGVERTVTQTRRAVEDTTLKARSLGQPGVAGELAQLRLGLRQSMRATQEALQEGSRTDASLRESLVLFERLSAHGLELDDTLRRLEREPDKARAGAALPQLRERVRTVTENADALRWAARDRAVRFAADDLDSLSAEIRVESGALRDWSRESLDERLARSEAEAGAATPAPEQARPEPTRPGPAERFAKAREQRRTPAIDPAAPAPAYPWQRAVRPETTT